MDGQNFEFQWKLKGLNKSSSDELTWRLTSSSLPNNLSRQGLPDLLNTARNKVVHVSNGIWSMLTVKKLKRKTKRKRKEKRWKG